MRRVVEDLTSVNVQVGEMFEAGGRKVVQGSDSSRTTFGTARHAQQSLLAKSLLNISNVLL